MMYLNDITTQQLDETGAHDGRLSALMPMLDQAAMTTGEEAPTGKQERTRTRAQAKQKRESLRDIFKQAREEALAGDDDEGRKSFKWDDLSDERKNDLLLRLGLSLMQHSPGSTGLEGIGKAGAETLGYFDQLQQAEREDRTKRGDRATEEAMRLTELAKMDRGLSAQEQQAQRAGMQMVTGKDGRMYFAGPGGRSEAVVDPSTGTPLEAQPAGQTSAFAERVALLEEVGRTRGMKPDEARAYAVNEALRNKTHIDPRTYASLRQQVVDSFRSDYALKNAAEAAGMGPQEYVDAMVDQMVQNYQENYGSGRYGQSDSDEPMRPSEVADMVSPHSPLLRPTQ